jgi:hypothetical protein
VSTTSKYLIANIVSTFSPKTCQYSKTRPTFTDHKNSYLPIKKAKFPISQVYTVIVLEKFNQKHNMGGGGVHSQALVIAYLVQQGYNEIQMKSLVPKRYNL